MFRCSINFILGLLLLTMLNARAQTQLNIFNPYTDGVNDFFSFYQKSLEVFDEHPALGIRGYMRHFTDRPEFAEWFKQLFQMDEMILERFDAMKARAYYVHLVDTYLPDLYKQNSTLFWQVLEAPMNDYPWELYSMWGRKIFNGEVEKVENKKFIKKMVPKLKGENARKAFPEFRTFFKAYPEEFEIYISQILSMTDNQNGLQYIRQYGEDIVKDLYVMMPQHFPTFKKIFPKLKNFFIYDYHQVELFTMFFNIVDKKDAPELHQMFYELLQEAETTHDKIILAAAIENYLPVIFNDEQRVRNFSAFIKMQDSKDLLSVYSKKECDLKLRP
ncbi:MAG: hypothetical protein JNM93_04920 [Bacteriovoracaceae bacterium]|nr:hypothetical protein [Bacteriovoracaceae bacterium]